MLVLPTHGCPPRESLLHDLESPRDRRRRERFAYEPLLADRETRGWSLARTEPELGPQWTGDAHKAWSLERQLFGLFFEPGGRPRRFAVPVFLLAVRFAVAAPFEDVFR